MNTTDENEHHDTAVQRAAAATASWKDAARLQRRATPDHAEFYALAGEIVETLYSLDDLVRVLARQVDRYERTQRERGQQVYDDSRGGVDPTVRLSGACDDLQMLVDGLSVAVRPANAFWSAIGHIGVEDATS